ncbi:TPA: hypothetical protein ACQJIS_000366 [Enterococcus faecium]|uniref:hypothetical protein n=1 Tax=Enterococcus faecium TaxID=1352 RepID=UPI000FDA80FF|nr:hypothetical protein [Enterococcus faecium]MCZ1941464.1 hypothetical protein [Enterococcus faecium]QCR67132.1 hypothetical protein FBF65_08975 [Enterococcus faecium]RYJ80338.1 hypothetical protein EWH76_05910 [Enterococcus faecium]HAP7797905.1 hypothetical protein [Enterococcus faecium]HAP7844368.1 hypothetical protein [Enterococcus faecium]
MRKVLVFNTRGQSFLGIEGTLVTVDGWCDCFEVGKHVELMAFTELKDKNNVEFFESDIGWDDHEEVYGKFILRKGNSYTNGEA